MEIVLIEWIDSEGCTGRWEYYDKKGLLFANLSEEEKNKIIPSTNKKYLIVNNFGALFIKGVSRQNFEKKEEYDLLLLMWT